MSFRPAKRQKLITPPHSTKRAFRPAGSTQARKQLYQNATNWNLEEEYEKRSRAGKREGDSKKLPIKTAGGVLRLVEPVEQDDDSDAAEVEWDEDGDDASQDSGVNGHLQQVPQASERERILEAKEELAKLALKLNEDPEEHPGAFKALAQVGQSSILAIRKLCLVTQMAVYKDVIPGYRIRPASEDSADKLSKEVRKLRTYELALVAGYQIYLKELASLARGDPSAHGNGLADVAITCACTLLNTVPHFNFRSDLLGILVRKLSTRQVDASFVKCRKALETLFGEDEEGRPSMEAVSLLSKMMKARDYRIDESVLNLFLHLRLLSEYSGKASQDRADQPDGPNLKKRKQKQKEIRSKREKKLLKEQKALEKDMEQADALVSHEEKDKMQSETLKLVFASYFRILKQRQPHLMGAVLEGLAKYAHLINQDFFGDLLEALKDLIRHSDEDGDDGDEDEAATTEGEEREDTVEDLRNYSREALLCTVTAFALLAGQDAHNARATLHLDLSFFTTHLFRSIMPLSLNADVELGAKSLHLSDPDDPMAAETRSNKVNLQTTAVLLVRCLTAILLPRYQIRSVPPLRLAAFTKQLMSAALHLPEKSCQAILVLLNDVSHTHGKKISSLWNTEERKGDGSYNALSDTVEGSNPFATTVWEGEILRKHFCPKVREGVTMLEKSLLN